MASENVSDRGHGLTSWLESEFDKLDSDRQKLIGRLVMRLAADNLSHKHGAFVSSTSHAKRALRRGRNDFITEVMRLETLMNPPEDEEVVYLASTNAPVDAFFESEFERVPFAHSVRLPDTGFQAPSRSQTGELIEALNASGPAAPPDNVKPGILTCEQAQARMAERTFAPDPARSQGDEMLSARAMADYLNASHTTIYNRYRDGRIIGLSQEVGGVVFPKTQFAEDGSPRGPVWLPGLDKIVAIHGNGWPSWLWLNEPRDEFGGETALDRLHAGDHSSVIVALNREEEGSFG